MQKKHCGNRRVHDPHLWTPGFSFSNPEVKCPGSEPKDWKCQECGKLYTASAAQRAMYSDRGCTKCGGSDIDLA